MIEPPDITYLEKAWEDYCANAGHGSLDRVVLGAWLSKRAGLMLQEIRILRTQVEGLQAALEEERLAEEGW